MLSSTHRIPSAIKQKILTFSYGTKSDCFILYHNVLHIVDSSPLGLNDEGLNRSGKSHCRNGMKTRWFFKNSNDHMKLKQIIRNQTEFRWRHLWHIFVYIQQFNNDIRRPLVHCLFVFATSIDTSVVAVCSVYLYSWYFFYHQYSQLKINFIEEIRLNIICVK